MGAKDGPTLSPVVEIFSWTVGQKPSKAKYYLDDTAEIIKMLDGLATYTAVIFEQTASTTDVPTKDPFKDVWTED